MAKKAKKKRIAAFRIERDSVTKKGPICSCGNNEWQNIVIVTQVKTLIHQQSQPHPETRSLFIECTKCKRRVQAGKSTEIVGETNEESQARTG